MQLSVEEAIRFLEKERYQRIARDMFRDDGRPKVSTVARDIKGRIVQWREGQPFGFLQVRGYEDVYVHESALAEPLRNAKEKVGFLVQFDLVARETFTRIASETCCQESARNVQLLAEPELTGTLTWKGTFGFIWTEDGTEYFCTGKDFLKEGNSLDTGAVVQFIGINNRSNRPHAVRISPCACRTLAWNDAKKTRKAQRTRRAQKTPEAHIIQTALDGRIVKLSADKDFGFIRPMVPIDEGADVYFKLSEQVAGLCLDVGAKVLFNLKDTEGRLSACDLTVLGQNPRSQEFNGLLTQLDDLISRNKTELDAVDQKATKDPCSRVPKDPCRRVPTQDRRHGPIARVPASSNKATVLRRKLEEPKREDDEQSQVSTAAESVVGIESWVLAQLG